MTLDASTSAAADSSRSLPNLAALTPVSFFSLWQLIGLFLIAVPLFARAGSDNFEPMPTRLEAAIRELGATPDRYTISYLMLPMRDGVRLATVVIRPRPAGRYPTLLHRTPYVSQRVPSYYGLLFTSDYVVVIQNERGSNFSEGEFSILHNTANDASDTIDWVTAQSWSNGRVGAEGCSSSAENGLLLAARGHPGLRALVAMSAGAGVGSIPGVSSQGVFYRGGVPSIDIWSLWYAPFGYTKRPHLPTDLTAEQLSASLRYFELSSPNFVDPAYDSVRGMSLRIPPSRDVLRRMKTPISQYETFMAVTPSDPVWGSLDLVTAADRGATPAININGWADVGAYESVKLFEFQQHHPDQYLVMAPTVHCHMTQTSRNAKIGDRPVGDTSFAYPDIIKAWFDRFLKGDEKAWKPMPRVQVFLMGANTWLTGERWPLPATRAARLYLAGAGAANTLWGDGRLEPVPPSKPVTDRFRADPTNPVPSHGGGLFGGSKDQRAIEARADVLVYSTPTLKKGLAIAGDIRAQLFISADTKDTDLAVKLVDVYPDGTAYSIQTGMLRLRYRDGFIHPMPLTPGQIYRVEIGGMTTANYFAPGHRLRIEIAGADFPNGDRNWNTGGPNESETEGVTANITVHHGAERASFIEFTEYTGEISPRSAPN